MIALREVGINVKLMFNVIKYIISKFRLHELFIEPAHARVGLRGNKAW